MIERTPRFVLPVLVIVGVVIGACGGATPSEIPSAPGANELPTPTGRESSEMTQSPADDPTSSTQAMIDSLIARVARDPEDGDAQLELGFALLQRIRETADPSLYAPAEKAFDAARRLLPDSVGPLVGLGGLQLGRHEFASALETGEAALEIDPTSLGAANVVIDALVELGRYDEAFQATDALAAVSADLPALARMSYMRELRGDLSGALSAMSDAAASPGLAVENTAFALAHVGRLQRLTGDPTAARASYERALSLVPNHAPSLAGLGRLAVGDGDQIAARDYFERAVAILPLAEYAIALGETLEAAGDLDGARRQYDLARLEFALFESSGVAIDPAFAQFEADHGDAALGLRLAESVHAATPTIHAADAVAWALYRTGRTNEAWQWSQKALRLGSRDPLLLFHAGAIAAGRHDRDTARELLTSALSLDPGFSATGAMEAQRILDELPRAS